MLTPFGVEFRYPGEEIVDRETAQEALNETHRVRAAILQRLHSYLAQGRPSS